VSVAGLKTTVLPQTSAGAIFHTGMATGKFHGVMAPTTPSGWRMGDAKFFGLVRATTTKGVGEGGAKILRVFARQRFAVQSPRFAGHEFNDVDGALHLAERVFQRLAFLASQKARQFFFLLLHDARGVEKDFAAIRCRRVAPGRKGRL